MRLRPGVGSYQVGFGRNVRGGNDTGAVDQPGASGVQADATVTVAGERGDVNGVFTFDQSGASADRPLHLQVDC